MHYPPPHVPLVPPMPLTPIAPPTLLTSQPALPTHLIGTTPLGFPHLQLTHLAHATQSLHSHCPPCPSYLHHQHCSLLLCQLPSPPSPCPCSQSSQTFRVCSYQATLPLNISHCLSCSPCLHYTDHPAFAIDFTLTAYTIFLTHITHSCHQQ